jgi:hypothetical protein
MQVLAQPTWGHGRIRVAIHASSLLPIVKGTIGVEDPEDRECPMA